MTWKGAEREIIFGSVDGVEEGYEREKREKMVV
jgi:hypothetical protein